MGNRKKKFPGQASVRHVEKGKVWETSQFGTEASHKEQWETKIIESENTGTSGFEENGEKSDDPRGEKK